MLTTYSQHYQPVLFSSLLILLSGCTHKSQIIKRQIRVAFPPEKETKLDNKKKIPPLTIWIHGTIFFRRATFDLVFDTVPSIKHIYGFPEEHKVRQRVQALHGADPQQYPLETFYAFGWSGKLNEEQRDYAACVLHSELVDLIEDFIKKYKVYPEINIITHSHGGNVALTLARMNDFKQKNIIINSLILMGCPVQYATAHLINNPIFERVYALYSSLDTVQILAPQFKRKEPSRRNLSTRHAFRMPPFSRRCFIQDGRIRQARVTINKHALFHTEFVSPRFITALPDVIKTIDDLIDENPGYFLHNKELLVKVRIHNPKKHYRDKLRKT